ncbi:MAG: DUF5054 domain-containing protein [Chthoniobacterales bacterium]
MTDREKTKKALVIFKTHLDIGFTNLARTVVQQYLGDFIPAALKVAKETREDKKRFVWTTGAWLIYRFLDDAPTGLRRQMEEAILAGDFHWHAMPFTTHTELLDESLLRRGLYFSATLDERFERKTIAAKMTDVPGHTRAMVPILAEAGIRMLHIGVNPASSVPEIPPAFVWRVDGKEIVVLYEKVYGSITKLPGGLALSVNLTNDNLGPQSPKEIDQAYFAVEKKFPKAKVVAGCLDNAAAWVWKRRKSLPVITSEIGDRWIHGVGTDPQKVSRFLALSRLRAEWIQKGKLKEGDRADLAFTEPLLLLAEHTWGMDIKTHLRDRRIFSRKSLTKALEKPNFRAVASSWREQRNYLKASVETLPAELRSDVTEEFRRLKPRRIQGRKWKESDTNLSLGKFSLALDPESGAIRTLSQEGKTLFAARGTHKLAQLAYQTFSGANYESFFKQYATNNYEWAQLDFKRTVLPASAKTGWFPAKLQKVLVDEKGRQVAAILRFAPEAGKTFGAPIEAQLLYRPISNGIDIELHWFDKPANRMPEAFWLGFAPALSKSNRWTIHKLGREIDTSDVVRNGARSLHVSTGEISSGNFSLRSFDAPLVAIDTPKLLNFDNKLPRGGSGVFVNLYNNIWNTNFPLWTDEDALFRFTLRFEH